MVPLTDEQRDLFRCVLLHACGDIRADNPTLRPVLEGVSPTVVELLKEKSVNERGLTRTEIRSELDSLNFRTTELAVLAIINYAVNKKLIRLQSPRSHPTIMACVRYLPV